MTMKDFKKFNSKECLKTGKIVLIAETKRCDLCDLDLGEMQEVDDRINEDILWQL
mgnify:FL=1